MSAVEEVPGGERAGRPLARRFTYRYALALAGFLGLAVFSISSINATLDRVDAANEQLDAVADQAVRLQQIASMADVLTEAELSPGDVGEGMDLGEMQVRYANTLEEFRNFHLGLTDGTGTTGLPAPAGSLRDFWEDPADNFDDELRAFHDRADVLTGLLGTTEPDADAIRATNDFVQSAANPRTGSVAVALEAAITRYTTYLDDQIQTQRGLNQVRVALTGVMALITVFVLFRPLAQRIQAETTSLLEAEREARENNERQLFRTTLARGLEGAGTEDEILGRVAAAMAEVMPTRPGELMLIDTNHAHLRHVQGNPAAGSSACPVDDPRDCVAIRRSQTTRFETSRALDVCPKLPLHEGAPCSAICAPVRFLGQALGVLHVIGPDLTPPDLQLVERLNVIADETGNRLGTLRATRQTEMQASTDGLTGLPNRRSLEAAAADLLATGRPFAVAIADLDHFKELNDTYGHEAGDRALRLFARTLRANLRPDDIAARYGGEEFVLLLPHASVDEARIALDRLRVTLAGDIAASNSTPFTASWGLTTSDGDESFADMIHAADEALYAAKRAGRNRVVVATTAARDLTGPEPGQEIVLDAEGGATTRPDTRPCPSCAFENPSPAKFCLRCGATVDSIRG